MKQTVNQEWMLVVEDQLDLWTLLRMTLRRALPQVEMVHAISKPAALTCLRDCSAERGSLPRLILQDLYVPERTDGLSLVRQLKGVSSPYQAIPVVVMSSSTDPTDSNEVYRFGATSYLVKPLDSQQWAGFLEQVRQYWWAVG